MDRRDFLHPRHVAQAAGELLAAAHELRSLEPEPPPPETPVLRFARRAMACVFEIVLPFGTPGAIAAADTAFGAIDALEQQMTVYRETSEVSRLNRLAPLVPVPVEHRLFELLALAARLHAETGGAYDITTGALSRAWGFYRGPRRVPSPAELQAARERVGMQHVRLDAAAHTVRYERPGLEMNLGSIGKGYALDRVAEFLRARWNLPCALLHGGTSSVYAMGTDPGDERGWTIGIRHPWDPERRLAVVRLRDRALGTSAATNQHLEYEGRRLGHILDPRTGWPAEGIACASVVAPSGAEADALATAFYVAGVDAARVYCESHPGVGAVLLPEGDGAVPVVVGLEDHEVTLFAS